MALTADERKMRLGHGGLALVARRTKRTLGHVSQVNRELREDRKVMRLVTRLIVERHPDIRPEQVWPQSA